MLAQQWRNHVKKLLTSGHPVTCRGQKTLELVNESLMFDARYGLIDVPARRLNYRFAVAEWLWMMFGHSAVEPLAQFNSVMRNFSDDGVWLTGAYGPHICAQRDAVVRMLREDPTTRQAVIEILRPRKQTKDEPCTLSLQFLYRHDQLNLVVTMRSSDVWLGVPYDAYTFAQILNCFAGRINVERGWVQINMASSHLYERDIDAAQTVLIDTGDGQNMDTLRIPSLPGFPPGWLEQVLLDPKRDNGLPEASNSWRTYFDVLKSRTSDDARDSLRAMSFVGSTTF